MFVVEHNRNMGEPGEAMVIHQVRLFPTLDEARRYAGGLSKEGRTSIREAVTGDFWEMARAALIKAADLTFQRLGDDARVRVAQALVLLRLAMGEDVEPEYIRYLYLVEEDWPQ